MEQKAIEWMTAVSGCKFGPDFYESIKDGVILCKVAESVMRGSVGPFVEKPAHYLENKVRPHTTYSFYSCTESLTTSGVQLILLPSCPLPSGLLTLLRPSFSLFFLVPP
jgi:hypothetical protein